VLDVDVISILVARDITFFGAIEENQFEPGPFEPGPKLIMYKANNLPIIETELIL